MVLKMKSIEIFRSYRKFLPLPANPNVGNVWKRMGILLFLLDEDFRPAGKTISFNSGEALQLYTLYEERKYVDTPEGGGYTGEWTERKESNGNIYRSKRFLSIEGFYDIDDGHEMESGFDLTQNLFNTDDKYEYLCAYYELVKGSTQEHDRDGDGMIDERITYYHTEISKIACESEGEKSFGR